jgi:hypothetical protein
MNGGRMQLIGDGNHLRADLTFLLDSRHRI